MISPLHALDREEDIRNQPVLTPPKHYPHVRNPDRPSFGELLGCLREECRFRHWPLTYVAGRLYRNGGDMVASYDLRPPPGRKFANHDGWVPSFGISCSTCARRGLRIYVGGRRPLNSFVVECFFNRSEWSFHRWFNLGKTIHDALDLWHERVLKIPEDIHTLKRKKLKLMEAGYILTVAGRHHVSDGQNFQTLLPGSRLLLADRYYREDNGQTAWDLVTAFGKACAQNSPSLQMEQLHGFYKLLVKEFL
jgi:hypothetical protein